MKEHSIIFSGEMVRAILEGRKTQTRRVVSQKHMGRMEIDTLKFSKSDYSICPYGQPGDYLWVRETWSHYKGGYFYRADEEHYDVAWKPSIHMPREASRLTLESIKVRAARLQNIIEEDAMAEGVLPEGRGGFGPITHINGFRNCWFHLNYKRGFDWNVHPWGG